MRGLRVDPSRRIRCLTPETSASERALKPEPRNSSSMILSLACWSLSADRPRKVSDPSTALAHAPGTPARLREPSTVACDQGSCWPDAVSAAPHGGVQTAIVQGSSPVSARSATGPSRVRRGVRCRDTRDWPLSGGLRSRFVYLQGVSRRHTCSQSYSPTGL